jgi:hypothetical protein
VKEGREQELNEGLFYFAWWLTEPLAWGGLMSILLKRAEHYRYLANEFRRLAANQSSIESRSYYQQMVGYYSTLAEATELKITQEEAREPSSGDRQFRPNEWRLAHAAHR